MARAQGARALMALAFETTYGTPPASGFTRMPFASTSLGAEQPLPNSELLGYGLDLLSPIKDAVTADGDVVVPLDAEAFGFWLKAAFGAPTTTGSAPGPLTHEFQSGSWMLPSMSIETSMPEVPRYAMYSGCALYQITWQMQRSGLLTATARLVAQGETVGTTTSAGTPAALELKRFGHFNDAITRNGSNLGNVVSAKVTYANNLDRIETIRSDGRIDGADPSIAALTGRIEVRFADQTLVTQAIPFEGPQLRHLDEHRQGRGFRDARNADKDGELVRHRFILRDGVGHGRLTIPPERLMRALLLQEFHTIRSERQLVERLDFDLLFRWFVGLGIDDRVWDASTYAKNRERFLAMDAAAFLSGVVDHPDVRRQMSREHFSVDGTLIDAWASMKSFRPKEERGSDEGGSGSDGGSAGGGRNAERDWRGQRRSNEAHASTTDPDEWL